MNKLQIIFAALFFIVLAVGTYGVLDQEMNLSKGGSVIEIPKVEVPRGVERLVTNFEECAEVTGVVLESYPAQCYYNGEHFVQEIEEPIVEPIVEVIDLIEYVTTFDECLDAAGNIAESYPRQCFYDGEAFTELIPKKEPIIEDSIESIVSVGPHKVSCTSFVRQNCLLVNGKLFYDPISGFNFEPGYDYQIKMLRTLAWGTTDPLQIPADAGLYAYEMLELISKVESTPTCVVAGCSSQLCISTHEVEAGGGISTCEFRPEYACYANSVCTTQATGECGWTLTDEMKQCLASPPSL